MVEIGEPGLKGIFIAVFSDAAGSAVFSDAAELAVNKEEPGLLIGFGASKSIAPSFFPDAAELAVNKEEPGLLLGFGASKPKPKFGSKFIAPIKPLCGGAVDGVFSPFVIIIPILDLGVSFIFVSPSAFS